MDVLRLIGFFVSVVGLWFGAKWIGLCVLAPFGHWLVGFDDSGVFRIGYVTEWDYAGLGLAAGAILFFMVSLPLRWYLRSLMGRIRGSRDSTG